MLNWIKNKISYDRKSFLASNCQLIFQVFFQLSALIIVLISIPWWINLAISNFFDESILYLLCRSWDPLFFTCCKFTYCLLLILKSVITRCKFAHRFLLIIKSLVPLCKMLWLLVANVPVACYLLEN